MRTLPVRAYAVNGFQVQAVGWVLVFNARALSLQESEELSGLWRVLLRNHAEDKSKEPPFLRLAQPRSIPLSQESVRAFGALVDRMAVLHPERFGWPALRARRNYWAVQAALGLGLGALTATWLPTGVTVIRDMVVALLLMGCGLLVPTVTLWRATSAVKYFTAHRPSTCDVRHSLASHSTQHEEGRATGVVRSSSRTSDGREPR